MPYYIIRDRLDHSTHGEPVTEAEVILAAGQQGYPDPQDLLLHLKSWPEERYFIAGGCAYKWREDEHDLQA